MLVWSVKHVVWSSDTYLVDKMKYVGWEVIHRGWGNATSSMVEEVRYYVGGWN